MVNCPPLCIIQARYNSTRLPGKMLLKLGGETLIGRGYRIACEAFGKANVVVAIPATDVESPLMAELKRIGARVEAVAVPEADVLSRFYFVAHKYRWHPDSVIVRYTPDDPFKDVGWLRRVAVGERLPVEKGGEAFTLATLDHANATIPERYEAREHITYALFGRSDPPPWPDALYERMPHTIDTPEDYERAREWVEKLERAGMTGAVGPGPCPIGLTGVEGVAGVA